jgi:hypothetical protein
MCDTKGRINDLRPLTITIRDLKSLPPQRDFYELVERPREDDKDYCIKEPPRKNDKNYDIKEVPMEEAFNS